MRIAVDCEFNGFGGKLISMALVAEDGREFYGELDLPPDDELDPWVREHVVPLLVGKPDSRNVFRLRLAIFLEQFEDQIVLMADWYTDLMHFFASFEGESHLQSHHIPCTAVLLPNMEFLPSAVPHNALEDARAIMATLKASNAPADTQSGEVAA